ncbi:MAG: homocysteine S-methyltransferase family protein [Nannocystaceae bacterium]|nr:homocysteine S-methyltransferase family protein [Nannocystaceae bacterium]
MLTKLLDGAMGTELVRRGFELRAPQWGARAIGDAPALVAAIHADYAAAGAEALVTASFGLNAQHASLAAASVGLARKAAPDLPCVGSIGPADPSQNITERRAHYTALGRALAEGGATALFAETQTSLAGARLAAESLRPLGVPVWVGLACGPEGKSLAGDPLHASLEADVVFVGCTEHTGLLPALHSLAPHNGVLAVRPSLASTTPEGFDPTGATQEVVIDAIERCLTRFELAYVGGCCGTTPGFTAALARAIHA